MVVSNDHPSPSAIQVSSFSTLLRARSTLCVGAMLPERVCAIAHSKIRALMANHGIVGNSPNLRASPRDFSRNKLRNFPHHDESKLVGMWRWAGSPEYFDSLEKSVRVAAQGVIQNALTKVKATDDKSLKINSEIIQGSPKQVIVEEAERWNADLVVMGSRGLGTWNRLLLGSVSNSVVHHAKCSVEIVRRVAN